MLSTDENRASFTCEEDDEGNLILPIPEGLLETMGWKGGTELNIEVMPKCLVLRELQPSKEDSGAS